MCNTTHHIKNTCVVCHTLKTLYDVFPLILIICLFSTCLITYLLHSLNVFYVFTEFLKLDFFFHMITFSFSCVLYLFNLNSQDYSDTDIVWGAYISKVISTWKKVCLSMFFAHSFDIIMLNSKYNLFLLCVTLDCSFYLEC